MMDYCAQERTNTWTCWGSHCSLSETLCRCHPANSYSSHRSSTHYPRRQSCHKHCEHGRSKYLCQIAHSTKRELMRVEHEKHCKERRENMNVPGLTIGSKRVSTRCEFTDTNKSSFAARQTLELSESKSGRTIFSFMIRLNL